MLRFAACLLAVAAVVSTCLSVQSLLAAGDQALANPAGEMARAEVEMFKLVNADRLAPSSAEESRGRARPFLWDDRLAGVARQHSEEMATYGYFSHEALDGSTPMVRLSRAGIRWRASAENIARYPDVAQAEAGFMNEPRFQDNHRGNILNPNYTRVGIGIAKGADGMFYITQDFAGF